MTACVQTDPGGRVLSMAKVTGDAQKSQEVRAQPRKPPTPGSWKKGQSGNPGGRPKIEGDIREIARKNCPEAIRILVEIARSKKAPHAARVAACREILDRGIGRPLQALEVSGENGQPIPMAYLPTRAVNLEPDKDKPSE